MSVLQRFDPPAKQNDFPNEPQKFQAFCNQWNTNVNGWTQQTIVGNPWNVLYSSNQIFYYNPLDTDIPPTAVQKQIAWFAFPNRIMYYFNNFSQNQQWELADNGDLAQGPPIPDIPTSQAVCTGQSTPTSSYGPYGPRGWQDEYCEWSVTRDSNGNITRVDFTCENPEYWFTLWKIDPGRVLQLYQQTLNNPHVQLADLYLYNQGAPVIDPATGQPAYNPLNKWNSGTVSNSGAGGAMHLTSTPNNLSTELALAGAATVLRQSGNSEAEQLICCSQYGQPQRNSDPHIGQVANQVVQSGNKISLANPVGLYIQMPDFSSYQLPDDPNLPPNAQPADCWQITRGAEILDGFDPSYNFILHATFALPQTWIEAGVKFTMSDITIAGNPINWASQIAQTFQIALYPLLIPTQETQPPLPCVSNSPQPLAQPLQAMYADLWDGYYNTPVPNPRNVPMNLASNTSTAAPIVQQGQSGARIALTCRTVEPGDELPKVDYLIPNSGTPDQDITVTVEAIESITYAVPGDSYPSEDQLLRLRLDIAIQAQPGQRDVQITNQGQPSGPPAPCFLVVAPATPSSTK